MLTLLYSCSSNSDDNSTPNTSVENTWKFGDHTYKHNGQISQQSNYTVSENKPFSITQATTVTPSNNGLFSGVTFHFNTHEAGTYTVKSQNTVIENIDSKYIYIEVINGNLQNQAAGYGSIDGNTTVTVQKVDGKFIITATDPIVMDEIMNTGLNAPTSTTFTCNKVK